MPKKTPTTLAYVDTSCIVAVCFDEKNAKEIKKKLISYDHLFSANLLEAEFLATCSREGVLSAGPPSLERINWVLPPRPLSDEYLLVLKHSHVRGADLYHIACALFLRSELDEIDFVSADVKQLQAATLIGLRTVNLAS